MKPGSRAGFEHLGLAAPLLMVLLAVVLCFTAVALFRRLRWSRWVAVALLVINVVPDAVRGFVGSVAIFVPISIVAVVAVCLALPVTGRAVVPRRRAPTKENEDRADERPAEGEP
jgi:general stress protein CsbA